MRSLTAILATALAVGWAGSASAIGSGGGGMGAAPSASAPAYDPAADYAHGVQALKAGQYKDASRSLKRVVKAVPGNLEAWRLLGEASAGEQDWKASGHAYEAALRLAPDDVAAHAGLGVALARTRDAKARTELDWLNAKAQACAAACPDAAALKAGAAAVQGALAGDTSAKPQAALREPMIFAGAAAGDLAYSTAVGLINQHRYDDALAALKQAEAVFGPHPDILTYQGYAWRKKGAFDRAESYYRQALAIAPQHRGATEYYGELKVERGDAAGARLMLVRLDAICAYGCAEAEELRRWIDHGGDPQLR
jgi:Tfp pilus assembly protein PilF